MQTARQTRAKEQSEQASMADGAQAVAAQRPVWVQNVVGALSSIYRPTLPTDEIRAGLFEEQSYTGSQGELASKLIRAFLWLIPVPELNILAYDVSTHRTGSLSPIFQRYVESFVTAGLTFDLPPFTFTLALAITFTLALP